MTLRLYLISEPPCTPLLTGAVKENVIGELTSGRAGLTSSVAEGVRGTLPAGGAADRELPQPVRSAVAQTTNGTASRGVSMAVRD